MSKITLRKKGTCCKKSTTEDYIESFKAKTTGGYERERENADYKNSDSITRDSLKPYLTKKMHIKCTYNL